MTSCLINYAYGQLIFSSVGKWHIGKSRRYFTKRTSENYCMIRAKREIKTTRIHMGVQSPTPQTTSMNSSPFTADKTLQLVFSLMTYRVYLSYHIHFSFLSFYLCVVIRTRITSYRLENCNRSYDVLRKIPEVTLK